MKRYSISKLVGDTRVFLEDIKILGTPPDQHPEFIWGTIPKINFYDKEIAQLQADIIIRVSDEDCEVGILT